MNSHAPTTQDRPTTPAVVQTFEEADTAYALGGAITIRLRSEHTDGRVVTPAGFEAYFEALAAAVADGGGWPPVEELVALGITHGSVPA